MTNDSMQQDMVNEYVGREVTFHGRWAVVEDVYQDGSEPIVVIMDQEGEIYEIGFGRVNFI